MTHCQTPRLTPAPEPRWIYEIQAGEDVLQVLAKRDAELERDTNETVSRSTTAAPPAPTVS